MTLTLTGLDSLDPLRGSVAVPYAQAEAADRLGDALDAVGGPVFVPRPPLILDDQFPAQLFHIAIDRLAPVAGAKPAGFNRASGSPAPGQTTRMAWRLPPSREKEGLAWLAFEN
jgi:hypothetical protein